MSRYYSAEWSARTRGAKWRTVTGKSAAPIIASSLHVAVTKAVKFAEQPYGKLAAITLHVVETGTVPPVRCMECSKSKQGGEHFERVIFSPAANRYVPDLARPSHKWQPNRVGR